MKHLNKTYPPKLSDGCVLQLGDFGIFHELVNELRELTGRKPFEKKDLSEEFKKMRREAKRRR